MKLTLLAAFIILLGATSKSCKKQALPAGCFKGRLEIKALCMNYTISVQSPNMDTALVVASWTDENTGKAYKNVFELASKCTFPESIKAGDEFYFTIDTTSVQNCAVCMAYYPTPYKKLGIKVLTAPCSN